MLCLSTFFVVVAIFVTITSFILIFICFLLTAILLCPKAGPWLRWSHTYAYTYIHLMDHWPNRKPLFSPAKGTKLVYNIINTTYTYSNYYFRCNKNPKHPKPKTNKKNFNTILFVVWHLSLCCSSYFAMSFCCCFLFVKNKFIHWP